MPFSVCRIADGTIRSSTRWDRLDYDKDTEVLVETVEMPSLLTKRWDGADGLRDATVEELDNAASSKAQTDAQAAFDRSLMLLAVARWTAQKLGVAPAVARAEILSIYANLLN